MMSQMKRFRFLLLCVFCSFSVGALATSVIVQPAKLQELKWGAVYHSHVSAYFESTLNFQAAGEITHLYGDAGDTVKQGDKLAQIDTLELRLKLKEAQMNVSSDKSKYKLDQSRYLSYKHLHGKSHVSRLTLQERYNNYIKSKNAYIKASVMLKVAETKLKKATLRAPFDVLIEKRFIQQGGVVSVGANAFKVYRLHPLEVEITLPEQQLHLTRVGDKAKVSIKSLHLFVKGVVYSVGSKPLYASSYPVVVRLQRPDVRVKPGMQAGVRLALLKPTKRVVLPLRALVAGDLDNSLKKAPSLALGKAAVFVYNPATKKVYKRAIVVDRIRHRLVVLRSGIKVGQQIAVSHVDQLKNGQTIQLMQSKEL